MSVVNTFLGENQVNFIRGKASVGHATQEEIMSLFGHIDALEEALDETDQSDTFGTEGWRVYFNISD